MIEKRRKEDIERERLKFNPTNTKARATTENLQGFRTAARARDERKEWIPRFVKLKQ